MKKISLLLTLSFLLFSFSSHAQSASVTGIIKDASSDLGLSYVHIQLKSSPSTERTLELYDLSNTDGTFAFNSIDPGLYTISVSHLGFYSWSKLVDITSQENLNLHIELRPALIPLGEVKVSSLRYERSEKEIPMPITVVPRENMPRQSSITLSDVLSKETGIALYRDGAWGTSVNIRGLGENRMVILINGNRVETATDLAAGLSMVDVNEIERVEVIKGAASSIYGTGAMAGVINIITKQGKYQAQPGIHGEATGLFEGVNSLYGTHVGLESGGKKWFLRMGGGYRDAGNMKTPDGILDNSQFSDYSLNGSFGWKPLHNHEFTVDVQNYKAMDVGIPGGSPFNPTAIASYPSELRRLISGRYRITNLSDLVEEVSLRYYNQYILRDVELFPNIPPTILGNNRITANRILPQGNHYTNGLVLESHLKLTENNRLVAGIDLWQRRLITGRMKYITQEVLDDFQRVVKTLEIEKGEKPVPDSRFSSMGIFFQDELSLMDDKLDLYLGARLDAIHVANDQAIDPVFMSVNGIEKDPIPGQRVVFEEQSQLAITWSAHAGGLYHLTNSLDLSANLGRSFRSPTLEERFKYIDLGSKVRLGDPLLKPEKGTFADVGFRVWKDNFNMQLNGFAHFLNDMIVETPGEFIYRLTTKEGVTLTDTLPALVNTNVDQALLAGAEFTFNYALLDQFVILGQASYVRGMNWKDDTDLPLIPPYNAGLGFRYQLPGIFSLEWTTRRYGAQNKIAAGETSTEGFWLSDFALFSAAKEVGIATFQIFAGVDNVFNEEYVNHLATNRGMVIAEPGRNVFVKVRMNF